MAETIVLDPIPVAVNRTQLDITSWVDADSGVNWGDAAITAYMADQQVGSSAVDYRIPNRQISIPLNLRAVGATSYSSIRLSLQQKTAILQAEGGQIMRQIDSTPLYADIENATLHLGGSALAAFRSVDVDAVLQLECLPDWYGAEITLDSANATAVLTGKLKLSAADAVIGGNYPGRARIVFSETSGNAQKGLLWGFRAANFNAAATSALFYEAEAMTIVGGATRASLAGASGGTVVQLPAPIAANSWTPMCATQLTAGAALTHTGTYRVWARVHSPQNLLSYRLVWGPGGLAVPNTNDADQIPAIGAFELLDLGQIHIDAPPVGSNAWQGIVQVSSPIAQGGTGPAANLDALYFQPLDESAGKLAYVNQLSPVAAAVGPNFGTTLADNSAIGTLAWSNPTNIGAADGSNASVGPISGGGATSSHYLSATGLGFAIPSTATILGIMVEISEATSGTPNIIQETAVRLVKAGVVQTPNKAKTATWTTSAAVSSYGGPSDLWSGTYGPTDVNATNFGAVIAVSTAGGTTGSATALVDFIRVTVYYTIATAFTVAQDAVVYASNTAEIRTEGAFRAGSGGGPYSPVATQIGDLPRIPPSRLENRPVELFVKPTRGDFSTVADSGLDSFSVQVKYRPSFLYVGA